MVIAAMMGAEEVADEVIFMDEGMIVERAVNVIIKFDKIILYV